MWMWMRRVDVEAARSVGGVERAATSEGRPTARRRGSPEEGCLALSQGRDELPRSLALRASYPLPPGGKHGQGANTARGQTRPGGKHDPFPLHLSTSPPLHLATHDPSASPTIQAWGRKIGR